MSTPERELAKRIRELRRRHFGARGKDEFARQLGMTRDEYDKFEDNRLPPGELMVRMCEITGEDLQWLLTGVSSRGAVVISGARRRHQNLLTRIASSLDADPKLAGPLEAFFDLLTQGGELRPRTDDALPSPNAGALLPVFKQNEWPATLPEPDDSGGGMPLTPILAEQALACSERQPARLSEPTLEPDVATARQINLITMPDNTGQARLFIESRNIARGLPASFGVVMADDTMAPMFAMNDVLVVATGGGPLLGGPALCKFERSEDDRCRIWLGQDENTIQLARVSDGENEQMPRAQLRWALEVLYRVAPAA